MKRLSTLITIIFVCLTINVAIAQEKVPEEIPKETQEAPPYPDFTGLEHSSFVQIVQQSRLSDCTNGMHAGLLFWVYKFQVEGERLFSSLLIGHRGKTQIELLMEHDTKTKRAFQAWLDRDNDNVAEEYFKTMADAKAKYPHHCSIVGSEIVTGDQPSKPGNGHKKDPSSPDSPGQEPTFERRLGRYNI